MIAPAPLPRLDPQVLPAHSAARLLAVAAQCAGPSCGLGGRAHSQRKTVHHVSEHPFTLTPAQTEGVGGGVMPHEVMERSVESGLLVFARLPLSPSLLLSAR
jgi:hypothetical protein